MTRTKKNDMRTKGNKGSQMHTLLNGTGNRIHACRVVRGVCELYDINTRAVVVTAASWDEVYTYLTEGK